METWEDLLEDEEIAWDPTCERLLPECRLIPCRAVACTSVWLLCIADPQITTSAGLHVCSGARRSQTHGDGQQEHAATE